MREQRVTSMGPGTSPGQAPAGSTSHSGLPDPVRRRQRAALADLRQAWGADQPVAREKRPGVLVKALRFLNNLW